MVLNILTQYPLRPFQDCHWSKEFDICLSKNTDTNTMNCELLTFRMQCAVRDDCRFAEKPHKCVALDKVRAAAVVRGRRGLE